MANDIPPDPRGRGANVFMLLILWVVVAIALTWAFLRNPTDAPTPSGTAAPATVPGGTPAS